MVKIILLVLAAEIFNAVGHLLYKKAANSLGPSSLRSVNAKVFFLKKIIAKPLIWFGFIAMSISLVIWLLALAEGQLSLVFPIGSIQYIFILILAHVFLGEKIDRVKLIGTLLVMLGIVFITMG